MATQKKVKEVTEMAKKVVKTARRREERLRSRLRHTHSRESIATLLQRWHRVSKAKWGKWLRRQVVQDACELFQKVQLIALVDKDFVKELEVFGMIAPLKKMQRVRNMQNPGATKTSAVDVSGDNGATLYDQTHNDIDESEIDITCITGGMKVQLREAIWWEWVVRKEVTLNAGGVMHETIEVDSDCYDGDHRLVVWATANGTTGTVSFRSTDR